MNSRIARNACAVALFLLSAALVPQAAPASVPKPLRVTIVMAPATAATGGVVAIAGRLSSPVKAAARISVRVEIRRGRRWAGAATAKPARSGAFTLRLTLPKTAGTVRYRIVVLRHGHRVSVSRTRKLSARARAIGLGSPVTAASSTGTALTGATATAPSGQPAGPSPSGQPASGQQTTHPPADAPGVSYAVPPTTRLYGAQDISSVAPGDTPAGAIVTFPPSATPPVQGGHVAIPPTTNLPDGLLARVVSITTTAGSETVATLEQAPLDEVLDDVDMTIDEDAEPELLDDQTETQTPPVSAAARGTDRADDALTKSYAPSIGALTCKRDGQPVAGSELISPVGSHALSLTVDKLHGVGHIHAGSAFDLTLTGSVIGSASLTAGSAFTCSLKSGDATLRWPFPGVAGVPMTVEMHPDFDLSVSAQGTLTIAQEHKITISVSKASGNLKASLRDDAQPATVTAGAALQSSLFVGGTARVALGGRVFGQTFEAGLEGKLGPEFTLDSDGTCIDADVTMTASLSVFLELWSKEWSHEIASASKGPFTLADTCSGDGASVSLHDLPLVGYPAVGGAAWSRPIGASGMLVPRADGGLFALKASWHSSDDGDLPFSLESLDANGDLRWRRPTDGPAVGGHSLVGDAAGNAYFYTTSPDGGRIRSVTPDGVLRWTTLPLPGDPESFTYTAPVAGADGEVWFAQYHQFYEQLYGIHSATGVLGHRLDVQAVGLGAYSGGLVVAEYGGGVAYYGYDGSLNHRYALPVDPNASDIIYGAGGTVFVAGPSKTPADDGQPRFTVVCVTPAGVAWTWTDPDPDDGGVSRGGAALPDGGVVLDINARKAIAIDAGGHSAWTHAFTSLLPIAVDAAGRVVLAHHEPYEGQHSNTKLAVDIVDQHTGATALPSLVLTKDGELARGDFSFSSIAIAPHALYAVAEPNIDNNTYSQRTWSVGAATVPSLQESYPRALATAVETGG
jgi:hypothetical protein